MFIYVDSQKAICNDAGMKKKSASNKTVLSLYISKEAKEKLKQKSKQEDRSMSAQASRIIEKDLTN